MLSDECRQDTCKLAIPFVLNASTTYKPKFRKLSVNFVTGELEGIIGEDHVFVGSKSIKQQLAFITHETDRGATESQHNVFKNVPIQGLLGLGLRSLSASGKHTSN